VSTTTTEKSTKYSLAEELQWWRDYFTGQNQNDYSMWVWDKLPEWLEEMDLHGDHDPATQTNVLFFSTIPYWVNLSLPIAVVISGYNCSVDFAWLPYNDEDSSPGPQQKQEENRYFWWSLRYPKKHTHPRLQSHNLVVTPGITPTNEMKAEAREQAIIDTQRITKQEEIDIDGDAANREIFNFRYRRNLECMSALAYLMDKKKYDVVVSPNGTYFEFGAAYRMAHLRGIKCVTFEQSERKKYFLLAQDSPAAFQEDDGAWIQDEPHVLTEERQNLLERALSERSQQDASELVLPMQNAPRSSNEDAFRKLNLDLNKPTAIMCSDVSWDSSVLGRKRIFKSMADWIRQTIDVFETHPEWQLIIRAHPREKIMTPKESVANIVLQHRKHLPSNIVFVGPNDPINTYDLLGRCSLGLVYCSSIGIEMAALGIPVITAAKVHYANKGFTVDPSNSSEYKGMIEECLGYNAHTQSGRKIELARCYFHVKFNSDFGYSPWNAWTLSDDITAKPISWILSPEGKKAFGKTFEYLAGKSKSPKKGA
jgi:hypothetical protein